MRRREKAVTETAGLENILWEGRVCQLALADIPAPYIVTLNYGYREGILYFHSAPEGHKIALLEQAGQVGFAVAIDKGVVVSEVACGWGTRFRSVVGHGRVEFIEALDEKRKALEILMAQYTERKFDLPESAIAETTVFRLIIDEMTGKESRA